MLPSTIAALRADNERLRNALMHAHGSREASRGGSTVPLAACDAETRLGAAQHPSTCSVTHAADAPGSDRVPVSASEGTAGPPEVTSRPASRAGGAPRLQAVQERHGHAGPAAVGVTRCTELHDQLGGGPQCDRGLGRDRADLLHGGNACGSGWSEVSACQARNGGNAGSGGAGGPPEVVHREVSGSGSPAGGGAARTAALPATAPGPTAMSEQRPHALDAEETGRGAGSDGRSASDLHALVARLDKIHQQQSAMFASLQGAQATSRPGSPPPRAPTAAAPPVACPPSACSEHSRGPAVTPRHPAVAAAPEEATRYNQHGAPCSTDAAVGAFLPAPPVMPLPPLPPSLRRPPSAPAPAASAPVSPCWEQPPCTGPAFPTYRGSPMHERDSQHLAHASASQHGHGTWPPVLGAMHEPGEPSGTWPHVLPHVAERALPTRPHSAAAAPVHGYATMARVAQRTAASAGCRTPVHLAREHAWAGQHRTPVTGAQRPVGYHESIPSPWHEREHGPSSAWGASLQAAPTVAQRMPAAAVQVAGAAAVTAGDMHGVPRSISTLTAAALQCCSAQEPWGAADRPSRESYTAPLHGRGEREPSRGAPLVEERRMGPYGASGVAGHVGAVTAAPSLPRFAPPRRPVGASEGGRLCDGRGDALEERPGSLHRAQAGGDRLIGDAASCQGHGGGDAAGGAALQTWRSGAARPVHQSRGLQDQRREQAAYGVVKGADCMQARGCDPCGRSVPLGLAGGKAWDGGAFGSEPGAGGGLMYTHMGADCSGGTRTAQACSVSQVEAAQAGRLGQLSARTWSRLRSALGGRVECGDVSDVDSD